MNFAMMVVWFACLTILGVVSFLYWIDITLGWGLPGPCSMALILDQLAHVMFTHLSYG
jgi:hypothetical protein